jgi:AcrR family transcriptional regulator
LQAEGPAAVTARRVDTAAGTSTAAVYELFGNKTGLVRSIFSEGFDRLADRLADRLDESNQTESDHEAAKRISVHVTGVGSTLLGTRRNAQVTVDAAHVLVALDAAIAGLRTEAGVA